MALTPEPTQPITTRVFFMSLSTNKQRAQTRHKFLLTFFVQDKDHYEYKLVNGYWLIKQFNANTNVWQVAIYTPEAFTHKQAYRDRVPNRPM